MSTSNSVALALSGGVDSAVAACLLKKQGYRVTAVHFPCLKGVTQGADCPRACQASTLDSQAKASTQITQLANQLKIPLKTIPIPEKIQQRLISYFFTQYHQGKTPNPDVICNKLIKFGYVYDWVLNHGFDYYATGHYAQVIKPASDPNQLFLARSPDQTKDQTYFLHQIKRQQLSKILFPIGHLTKPVVRKKAQEFKLSVADKPDSTGLCFLCQKNARQVLKEKFGTHPGEIVTESGAVIGQHQGLWLYTIGQRKGLTINQKLVKKHTNLLKEQTDLPPLFVIDKNFAQNQLIVGPKAAVKKNQFLVKAIHWLYPELNPSKKTFKLQVRIRHTGKLVDCQLQSNTKQFSTVKTKQKLAGIAPGQFAVFYTKLADYSICLGGGEIT